MIDFKTVLSSCDLEGLGFVSKLWPLFREYQLLAQEVWSATSGGNGLIQKLGGRYGEVKKIILDIESTLHGLQENTIAELLIQTKKGGVWLQVDYEKHKPRHPLEFLQSCAQVQPIGYLMRITQTPGTNIVNDQLQFLSERLHCFEETLKEVGISNFRIIERQLPNHSPDMVAWNLNTSAINSVRRPSPIITHSPHNGCSEMLFGKHPRKKVDLGDLELTRAICKLFLHSQTQSGTEVREATGWLDGETIVTCGHCVYDMQFGHITAMEAILGYGDAPENVESRWGSCVVVHWGWYKTFASRHDLAFIRLTEPFEKARPIPWTETPITAKDMQVGAPGFPGDIPEVEPGRYMYESDCFITFNLATSDYMLEYDLDTWGGNSGGPILILNDDWKLMVIGMHRGWGWGMGTDRCGQLVNKAITIDSKRNNFRAFFAVLDIITRGTREGDDINEVGSMMSEVGKLIRYGCT